RDYKSSLGLSPNPRNGNWQQKTIVKFQQKPCLPTNWAMNVNNSDFHRTAKDPPPRVAASHESLPHGRQTRFLHNPTEQVAVSQQTILPWHRREANGFKYGSTMQARDEIRVNGVVRVGVAGSGNLPHYQAGYAIVQS
ncbi:MAG: hypothetical protein U1E05_18920, partial [Patescibacteria group bacterium]|nr:hypothetical protein [Patescibacteria group bacterium]